MARIHKIIESREVTKVEDVEIKALEPTQEEAGLLADLLLYAVDWHALAKVLRESSGLSEKALQDLYYKLDGLREYKDRPYHTADLTQVIDEKAVRRMSADAQR
jgi:hypothetical protein